MKILFLSRWYPYPANNGSKIRIRTLLDGLCREHEVTLVSFYSPGTDDPEGPLTAVRPAAVKVCAYREFRPRSVRASLGFLAGRPRFLLDTRSAEMARIIESLAHSGEFDLVIASQLAMASYVDCFRGLPAIFDEVELGLFHVEPTGVHLPGSSIRRRLRWQKFTRYLRKILTEFRACTVASEQERRLLAEIAPAYTSVEVLPNSVDVEGCAAVQAPRDPHSLIFTGSFRYLANYDGITWFLREVYPCIRAEAPEVSLTITGDSGAHPSLAAPGVRVTGCVPEVQPLVASAAVSVVPVRMGGGTRLKILESMALKTPVVATSKGCEGLDARHGEHLLIADTADEFAQCVLLLLRDAEHARTMANKAFDLVRERYNSRTAVSRILALIDRVAGEKAGSAESVRAQCS